MGASKGRPKEQNVVPKKTKSAKTRKTRTKAKGLSKAPHDLTAEDANKIKGGFDPTSVRLPSPVRAINPQPQKT